MPHADDREGPGLEQGLRGRLEDVDARIGKYSEADIAKTIKTMVKRDGKPIMGPMMFYASQWSQLTDDDAMAIAKFLKTIPPMKNKVLPTTWKPKGPPPGAPPPK